MTEHVLRTASRFAAAIYLIGAGLVISWPLVALVELVRLSQ
jgi:hypothetical protein